MRLLLAVAVLLLASCTTSNPTMQTGPGAIVSHDGLHKVDGTSVDQVWIAPDIDLSQYSKLLPESLGIEYRFVRDRGRNSRAYDGDFPLNDQQRAKVSEAVVEALRDELSQSKHFTRADSAGAGVLTIRLGLADVVSHVPPEPMGRSSIYLSNLGEATLAVELRDSRSNEILARIIDRRAIEPAVMMESSPVTNYVEVKRAMRFWGQRLASGLDELHERGCIACGQ